MSATTAGSAGYEGPGESRQEDRLQGRVFRVLIIAGDLLVLSVGLATSGVHLLAVGDLLIWALLIAIAGSITLPKDGYHLGFDLPVLLGAGLVFGPLVAGMLGLVAVFDIRELRRDVSADVALFNRAEISLSAMAAAAVFQSLSIPLGDWPWTAVAGLVALVADVFVNYCLVAGYWGSKTGRPILEVASEMRFGPAKSFVPTYACFGFMGVLIAEAYVGLGILGVVAFVGPVLVARQAFSHRQLLDRANQSLGVTRRALAQVDRRVAKERKDERLTLAGELHDEILPPLFQVHLMAQVLRQDLASGRLLDLDEDLPALLEATEMAQSATRSLVRDLRRSALGAQGLLPTIRLLAEQLESSGAPRIVLDLEEVGASANCELLIYQVVREALTNAARYSKGQRITVSLRGASDGEASDSIRFAVVDDGIGFDPRTVDSDDHFGLQLIAERVDAVGGAVTIDSRLGDGTSVQAVLPFIT
jgi:signal transduction histidine kinase